MVIQVFTPHFGILQKLQTSVLRSSTELQIHLRFEDEPDVIEYNHNFGKS